MKRRIQFWFEFASTYSYLSAMRIVEAAAKHDVAVDWQPFLLGPIFAEQGWDNSPFNLYPAKGRYMWRDLERLSATRELPFVRPDPFPQNGLAAARIALAARELGKAGPFVRAVFDAEFGIGQDISKPSVLTACLAAADLPDTLLERSTSPEIKSTLFEQVAKAKTLGIFGAPSFLVEDELYWGDDRLDQALAHAATF